MTPALVPELSVTDWRATQAVLHTLGFTTKYERPTKASPISPVRALTS